MMDRFFLPAAALLLAAMACAQVASIRLESQTFDEGTHLAAGLSYWKTGDYRMNPEHPPLPKLLCAVPLLFMNVRLPFEYPSWSQGNELDFGGQFLYANNLTADQILFPARMVTIVLTLLLGVAMAWWTRRVFGAGEALLALAFLAFDPNVIAQGRYVTTDLAVALFSFLACVLWADALRTPTWLRVAAAGLALGLALASKFNALFLIPALLVLTLFRWPGWKRVALLIAVAYVTLLVPYIPDLVRSPALVPHAYSTGLAMLLDQDQHGRLSYLLGQISTRGWWYYFPVAYLVKTPVALGGGARAAAVLYVARRPKLPFEALALAVPAAIYWCFCLASHIDLGIRHLLPAYVLMIPLAATVVVRAAPKWLPIALVVLLAVESASIYPDYLAFFNWPSGGPSNGPRYLVDSNIDWGQDTKKLKTWLDARGIHEVCRVYFGMAVLSHHGIAELPLPANDDAAGRANLDCWAAASVTPLYGLHVAKDPYRWLREKQPVAKIGYSIYVYDLRKR